MAGVKTLVIALSVIVCLPLAANATEASEETAEQPAPKCLEAAVNPVTGHAICVNPRGAPVDPPPDEALAKPCKPRSHDDDPFTVYERYSAFD